MVANVHKGNSKGANLKSALDYNLAQGRHAQEQEEKSPQIVISNNITGTTSSQITKEFKNVSEQNTNKNFKNKEFHFSVSFPINDTTESNKRIEAVEKSIQNFGVDKSNFQYLAVEHFDKPHAHFHVTINRVGFDGETLNTKNDYAKLQKAIDQTEKEMGLDNSLAEKRRFVYDPSEEKGYKVQKINQNTIKKPREKSKKIEETKIFIQKKVDEALTITKVKNVEELKSELKKGNINFEYTTDEKGIKGTSFKTDKLALKGSNIGFKASVINAQLKINEKYSSLDLKVYQMEDVTTNRNEIKKSELLENLEQDKSIKEEKSAVTPQERFKKADIQIYLEVEKLSKLGEFLSYGQDIDPILRKEIGEEFPNENIWAVIEKFGEKDYENHLNEKMERINEEIRFNSIETKLEQNREQEKQKTEEKIQELRKETLQNLDKVIGKIEPYKDKNLETYETIRAIKEAVNTHEINAVEDLSRANQIAKNLISTIESQEKVRQEEMEQDQINQLQAQQQIIMDRERERQEQEEHNRNNRFRR